MTCALSRGLLGLVALSSPRLDFDVQSRGQQAYVMANDYAYTHY